MKVKPAFDLDGTLAQTWRYLRETMLAKFCVDIYPQLQHHCVVPGYDGSIIGNAIYKVIGNAAENIPPYPDTIETLNRIYEVTSTPTIIITARNNNIRKIRKATERWCKTHLQTPYELHMVPTDQKQKLILDLEITLWCDDRLKVANEVAKCDHIRVFLINRIWNMGRETNDRVRRIDFLKEVLNWLDLV